MLQLEVGKCYRNRKGEKIGPLRSIVNCYPYEFTPTTGYGSWTIIGKVWDGDPTDDENDLIEEWKDEEMVIDNKTSNSINDILAQRQSTHGDFTDNARIMQTLKDAVMQEAGWQKLSLVQREALHMILHKVGRIVSGNPNEPDHWLDIAGYATLAKDRVSS